MGLIPFVLLFALTCALEPVIRKEYGVIFTPLGQLNTATSSWHHTFAYDINAPDIPEFELNHCESDRRRERITQANSYFEVICNTYEQYSTKAQQLKREIKDGERSINALLPITASPRTKRGAINAIGRASKWLFGTSTEEDTRKLDKQIDWLRERVDQGRTDIAIAFDETRSNMHQLSKRQDLTNDALRLLDERFTLQTNITDSRFNKYRDHQYALWLGNLYIDMLYDLRTEVTNNIFGVQTLLDGYLPAALIPPVVMRKVLGRLSRNLRSHNFNLAFHDIAAYYKTKDIVYERHSDFLFITIKIPLESIHTLYQLYRIDTVPLLSGDVQTQIQFEDPYLAVSDGNYFYFQLSEADYASCTGINFQKCHRGFAIKERTNPSCIMSLFENDHVLIKQLCDFQFLLNSDQISTQIIPVDETSYLISTIDTEWIQTCPQSTPMHVDSCNLCVIQLPCACSLKGRTFFVPPSLEQCNSSLQLPVTKVSHNFATLMKYYENLLPALNLSYKLLQTDVEIQYPSLAVANRRFKEVLQDSDNLGVSINTSLEKFKSNDRVYADSVAFLYDRLGLYTNPIVTTGMPALSSVTFVLSVCALAVSLRNMFMIAMLAKQVAAVPWESSSTTPAPNESVMPSCISCSVAVYLLWAGVLILCALVIYLAIRKLVCPTSESGPVKYSSHTMVSLIFVQGAEYVELLVILLPFPMDSLEIKVSDDFIRPRILTKCFTGKLVFDWTSIEIKALGLENDLILPVNVFVPMRKYRKHVRVIGTADVVQLRIASGETTKIIHTWIGSQIRTAPQ